MKLLICSDIHGDLDSIQKVFMAFKNEDADKMVILGDLLYHGPRNDLPSSYAPKDVIELLNANKEIILAVRGNCDTEVDQMVLEFPILADYAYLSIDGIGMFLTHGHRFGIENPPPLKSGEILLCGHTHILKCESFGNENLYLNPGSAALPKGGNPRSYMVYENRTFTVKTLDGEEIFKKII
ncbi:MAG: phosphodiesterase [Clostridia bacterium]|nr:phosphodiesterase [Clostridia bacterium]